jgi:hypothetical protein
MVYVYFLNNLYFIAKDKHTYFLCSLAGSLLSAQIFNKIRVKAIRIITDSITLAHTISQISHTRMNTRCTMVFKSDLLVS